MWKGTVSEVDIRAQRASLGGTLSVPDGTSGIVLFAHGSGSSRHSPRNKHIAESLNEAGIGTLLLDLLTAEEEIVDIVTGHLAFDINLLAERLVAATAWLMQYEKTRLCRFGYFGASTGAAAALVAAAELPRSVLAVVSRGGRPDLAAASLPSVGAATLLIVGGNDAAVIEVNRTAFNQLRSIKQMEVVAGAGHLFEEPGALDMVSKLATRWFEDYLMPTEDSVQSTAS